MIYHMNKNIINIELIMIIYLKMLIIINKYQL